MTPRWTIVGLGEALFDLFGDQPRLGGAPLNAAVHAHQLLRDRGGRAIVVSRVGQDDLGRRVHEELAQRGMEPAWLQTDPDKPTGRVYVTHDEHGGAVFDIVEDVAWDWLQFDPDLEDLANRCDAVCFGTLAQRNSQSRSTIQRFLALARRAFRLLDVNLRPPWVDRRVIERSLEFASAVKLSASELTTLAAMMALEGDGESNDAAEKTARSLIRRYDLKYVALTRGALGTVLFTGEGRYEGAAAPEAGEPSGNGDAVGAGDAVSATLIASHLLRLPLQKAADLANAVGAHVATQSGATPELPERIVKMVRG